MSEQTENDSGDNITILPYVKINPNDYSLSDDVLHGLWDQIVKENLVSVVFHDGKLNDAQAFIDYLKSDRNLPIFVFVNHKIQAMAWLNSIMNNYAFGHFLMLSEAWGKYTHAIGSKIIDYWFSFPGLHGYLFDLILGLVPDDNMRAHRFVKGLGFIEVGTIPKMLYNAKMADFKTAKLFYILNRKNEKD